MLRIISSNDAYFAAAAAAAGDEFTTKTTTTTTTTTINNNNNNILTGSWKKFPNHTYTTPDNKNNKRYYCSTPKSNISKKRCYPSPLDKIRCENYRRRIIDFGLETCSEKSFELNQSFPREKRKRNNHNNNNNNNNNYYESLTLIEPTNTTTINVKPLKLKYDNNNNKEFIGMDKIRVDGSHGLRFTTRRKGCFTPGNASSSFISGSSIVVNNSTNTTITSTPVAAATAAVSSGVSSTITTTPIVTNINNINNNNKNTAIVRIPKNGINPHKAVFIIDSKTSKILIVNNNACQLLGYTSKELCDLEFSNLLTCKHSNNTHVSALAEVQMNSEDGTMVLLSGKVVEMNTVWNTKIAVSLWIRQIDIAGRCLAVAEPVERIVAEIIIDKNGLILSCDVDALMLFQIESTNHICGNQIQTLIPAIQLPDSDNGSGSSSNSGKTIIKEIRKQKATGKTADNLTFPLCLMINHNHNHNHNHHQDSTIIMDSNNDSGNVSNIGASGGGGGGNNSSSSNNIDHNNSYVLTIWVYQNISGLMVINELGTIESCNHHFSMLMFGYTQSKIIDRPITDVIPNFGQEFEYVDYIQTNNSHSRNGTSSSLLIDSINNINNTNNTNNNNINTSNHNKNIDDSEDATTDPIYNIDCRIACNFSYDDDDDDGDDDGKCSNQENTINYLNNNINGGHPIISQHHHHHHHDHHRHRRHPQSDGIPFIWKTNSEPDKLASTASTALSKQNNDYENMMINSNTTTTIDNNIQCFITKSMSDNSLIVMADPINNYENNNKNLSNVQNYQNKCNNIKCKINTQSPSSSSSFIDNFKFNLEDEHFIVQNNGTLLIKNHPINLFQHGTRTTINKIPSSSSSSSSMVGIAGVGGNDFNELNDIEQLTPVNETADDDNISEYLLRNSLSNKQNNPIDNNTIELEKLNLYSDDDDDDDDNKRDFGEIKTPTKSEFESSILREQKTPKSEANKTDCCSKSTDNFFNLQRRTSNAIINLPTPPSSSITTITNNNNNNNNNNQLQLNLNDGKYKGEAIHHDGNILDILYTISSHILPCGRKVFCVWICRDPDVDDVDDDDDDDDQYLQDDDEKHQNLTLTFNSLTSTVDNSLGQIIKSSAVAATAANGTGTGSSSAAAVGAGTSNTIQNSSRPNSVSLMSQCEDDQINGEYGKYYTTLKQIGKGAYGYVKMGYRNSDRLLIITKFILKCKLSPQFMVKTTTATTTTTTTDADNNGRGGGGGVGVGEIPMEIYLLTTVKHPNIVAVFDVFENEKFFQMIMERHGSGMDLFEFIDRCRMTWMDEKLGAYIFRQIANAIDYLHTLNILHRDIKDENIIIDQNFHVKLIDFGSATFMEDGRLFSTFYGTTEYCSPEVLAGNKYAGPELEMWSLGVTLYVLMFFENPFLEIEDTLHEELAIPQIISLPLENLLFAMLDKNPKTRCTMKELLKCEWITQEINPLVFNFSMIVQSCAAHELNPEKYFSGQVYSHTTTTTTMTTTGGGVGDGGGGGCCVGGHSTTSPQDSLALADDDDDDGDDVDEDSLHVDTNELDDGGLITDNGLLDVIVCHHHHHHHVDDDELGDDDDEDVEEDDEEDDDDDRSQPSQSGCEKYSKLTTTAGDDETVQIDITSNNNNNNNSETIINVFKGKQYLPIPNQKSTVMKVTKKDSVILPSSPLLLSSQSSGAMAATATASTSTSITNNNTSISGTDIPNENSIEHSIACNISGYSSSSSPPSTTTTTTSTVFKKHNNYDKMIKSLEDIKKPIITKTNHQNSTIDSKCNNVIIKTTNRKTIRPNNNGIIKTIPNNGKIKLNDNKTIEEKKTTYELKYNNNNNNSNIGDKINKNHHQRYDKYNNDDDDGQDNEYDDEEYDDDDEYDNDDDEVEEEPDDDLDKESYL